MFAKDIKLIFREPGMAVLLLLLVASVAVAILFGKPDAGSTGIKMGVADYDASEYSKMLIAYFKENPVFTSYTEIVEADESELEERFRAGELDIYLVIPKDFAANLININNVAMKAVVNSADTTKAVVYGNLLESYSRYITSVEAGCQSLYDIMTEEGYPQETVRSENVSVSYDLIFTALGKDSFFSRDYIERFEGISTVNYYIYSLIMLLVLYIGAFAGYSSLRERLGSAEKRLASLGMNAFAVRMSKAGAYTLVCGGFMAAALVLTGTLSDVRLGAPAVLMTVLAIFISCIVFIFAGALFRTAGSYMITANMVILLLTVAGGGIIPIMYLPEAMASVARFTPNYWFIRMLL